MTDEPGDTALLRFDELVCEPASGVRVVASGAVPPGGVLLVRGPSGAGKSTLLRALARLQPIVSGRVWFKDRVLESFPATHWRRLVHYSSQRPVVFDGTVADNVLVPWRLRIAGDVQPPIREQVVSQMNELAFRTRISTPGRSPGVSSPGWP